jgi:hypothetical protein
MWLYLKNQSFAAAGLRGHRTQKNRPPACRVSRVISTNLDSALNRDLRFTHSEWGDCHTRCEMQSISFRLRNDISIQAKAGI